MTTVCTEQPRSLLVEVDPLFKTHGVNAYLCGLVGTSSARLAFLTGMICVISQAGIAHVNVVTRSMAAAMATNLPSTQRP